jgi:predicted dehydrogenase
MKLGLLGIDARIAQVVAAAAHRGDTIAIGCDLPATGALARVVAADVPRDQSWESLLDARVCDAVLVGVDGWNDRRADGVRALVQAGRTLLLSHPLTLSMLWAYELDMIRGDSGSRLIPFLPDRLHPFIRRLQERIEAGLADASPLGAVETITMERRLVDRSRDAVLRALAADADLVRVLAGDPSRLSTLGAADAEAAWNTLAVGFSGPSQVPVRWQVVRGDRPSLRIAVNHAHGSCAVDIPDIPADAAADGNRLPWTWSEDGSETAAFDRGVVMLDVLHNPQQTTTTAPAVWSDAARAIELAETVPRSLAKGRAIDLHQEEFSELGTFRGTMASLGCGLVLAALLVLVLATLVGGIAREAGWEWGERLAGLWPQVVLAVLGLFLALQVLPLLVGASRPETPKPPSAAGDHGDLPEHE